MKFPDNWSEIRERIFHRDNHTCYRCLMRNVKNTGLTVHHLMPRIEGGSENEENLITLCKQCHDYVEINDIRTLVEIEASIDLGIETRVIKSSSHEETFARPSWHTWVYGGLRNPDLDR